jgi:hypothetical protein
MKHCLHYSRVFLGGGGGTAVNANTGMFLLVTKIPTIYFLFVRQQIQERQIMEAEMYLRFKSAFSSIIKNHADGVAALMPYILTSVTVLQKNKCRRQIFSNKEGVLNS